MFEIKPWENQDLEVNIFELTRTNLLNFERIIPINFLLIPKEIAKKPVRNQYRAAEHIRRKEYQNSIGTCQKIQGTVLRSHGSSR